MKKTLLVSTSLFYLMVASSSFAAHAPEEDPSPRRNNIAQNSTAEDTEKATTLFKTLDLAYIRSNNWMICSPDKDQRGLYSVPDETIINVLQSLTEKRSKKPLSLLAIMAENNENRVTKITSFDHSLN
jgi:hypothetical protein